MKKVILCVVLIVFGLNAVAKEKRVWEYSDGNLQKVFTIDVSKKSNELLRLYDDGTYEHLKYIFKSSGKEEVQRNTGNYELKAFRIHFTAPEQKSFTGKFKYGAFLYNGKFYAGLIDLMVRKKNELFKSSSDKKFYKPFFICPNSEKVVNNSEADESLDLERLMDYILEGKTNENEKVLAIVNLIIRSVEYDADGYSNQVFANNQTDVKSILAGSKRLAVGEGYAHTMKTLCEISDIRAEEVRGNTKQSFSDLNRVGGQHVWNIAEVNGKRKLYDLTWADEGEAVDMSWIDVEPTIMIGTHFPDRAEDQLLSNPVAQENYIKASVVKPSVASAAPLSVEIPARIFAGDVYKLALPGKHSIIARLVSMGTTETGKVQSYNSKPVGNERYSGDSTYFTFPLSQVINPLVIEIDGQLEIKTVVFKGGQTDLMNYYISKADPRNVDSYVRAVVAAIRLKDEAAMRKLMSVTNPVFFDSKGKLKLDNKVFLACLDWTGELGTLKQTKKNSIITDESGSAVQVEETEMSIEVPGKLKFILQYDALGYEIRKCEIIGK